MDELDFNALKISPEAQTLLREYGFDGRTFATLRSSLAAGEFPMERNHIAGAIEPPNASDLLEWPEPGSSTASDDEQLGRQAIEAGEVAVAILNGGMATRFGGGVKGIVEVLDGQSFLALKLRDVARQGHNTSVFLMNSFATAKDTNEHLAKGRFFGLRREQLHQLNQRISLRLTADGEIFRDARGRESLYAPGHGDLFEVLAEAPSFESFANNGGKYVLVSNVDNLAATLSPRIIGAHIRGNKPVTVEVAPRAPTDAGGAPVRYNGKMQVVEGFRFPKSFDIKSVPVFNTNTMVINTKAVRSDYPLTWFRADKKVEQKLAVQFERLMGEVTAFVDATYLKVPRHGPEARFLPVKTPDDLINTRPAVRELFGRSRT